MPGELKSPPQRQQDPNNKKNVASIWLKEPLLLRYETRCYFNVRSKADISELNLALRDTAKYFEENVVSIWLNLEKYR